MISKDIISGKHELTILSNPEVDRNLPKYKTDNKSSFNSGSFSIGVSGGFNMDNSDSKEIKEGFISRLLKSFKRTKKEKVDFNEVKAFFENIKVDIKKLNTEDSDIIDIYLDQIEKAKSTGQQALVDMLLEKSKTVGYESLLLNNGITRFIESDTIVKYYQMLKHKKLLKLVYIKNFVRIIPNDIIEEKLRVDELKIFDNYVVLGFDKDDKMSKMTKKEIEKAKDPILFGIIKGSNRLYFIGEWEDEHCDLTLDEIYEKTNVEKKKLNKSNIIETA
jgi:hypothetical protein